MYELTEYVFEMIERKNSNLLIFPGTILQSAISITGTMTYTANKDCIINIVNFHSKTFGLGANVIVNNSYRVIGTADNMSFDSVLFPLKKGDSFKTDENCVGSYTVFNIRN